MTKGVCPCTPTRRAVVEAAQLRDYTRVYISHNRESVQAVHTHSHTIRTLFAQSSHRTRTSYSNTIRTRIRTVAHYSHAAVAHYSHTIRTVAHTIRTVAHYSHTIRTLFARSHTLFARSQTIRKLFAR